MKVVKVVKAITRGRQRRRGPLLRARLVWTVCLLSVIALIAGSSTLASSARNRAGIVSCLAARQVLLDAGAAQYLPAVVIPRSRQVAISFPFTPGEVGLAGLVIVTPSVAAARAAIGRMIVYSAGHGSGSSARIRAYIEQRGPLVVGWWAVRPNAAATKILTTCLGRRTDR